MPIRGHLFACPWLSPRSHNQPSCAKGHRHSAKPRSSHRSLVRSVPTHAAAPPTRPTVALNIASPSLTHHPDNLWKIPRPRQQALYRVFTCVRRVAQPVLTAPGFQHVHIFARRGGLLGPIPAVFQTELGRQENTPVQLQRPGGCRDAPVMVLIEEVGSKSIASQPQSSNTWRCRQCFGPDMLLRVGRSGIRSAAKSPLSGTAFALDISAQKTRNHTTAIQRCVAEWVVPRGLYLDAWTGEYRNAWNHSAHHSDPASSWSNSCVASQQKLGLRPRRWPGADCHYHHHSADAWTHLM